jgi:hypothetical protein
MSESTEYRESGKSLEAVEHALETASKIPYNNAEHAYTAAGVINPDLKFGGSCLHKLMSLKASLPTEIDESQIKVITSVVGNTTHYAMVINYGEHDIYLDPFLWQANPMNADKESAESETLMSIWRIKRQPDQDGQFTVSFVENTDGKPENRLITHKFTGELDQLPSPAALPLKPDLPSFMMQIPDQDNQKLYKVWYSKEAKHILDISVTNGKTGEKKRVTRDPSQRKLRAEVVNEVERLTRSTEKEIVEYFAEAHEKEVWLKEHMSDTVSDVPLGHNDNI